MRSQSEWSGRGKQIKHFHCRPNQIKQPEYVVYRSIGASESNNIPY